MTEQLIAGAPVLFPARTPGGGPFLHLARTEARKRAEPALIGTCPAQAGVQLERAPARPWWLFWRRRRWCPQCADYRRYLEQRGQL